MGRRRQDTVNWRTRPELEFAPDGRRNLAYDKDHPKAVKRRKKAEQGDITDFIVTEEDSQEEPGNVRYSFLTDFEEQERNFEKDFDKVPNRFFNANLRGNLIPADSGFGENEVNLDVLKQGVEDGRIFFDHRKLASRICLSMGDKTDLGMSAEEFEGIAEELGLENLEEVTDPKTLRSSKSTRAWKATLPVTTVNGEEDVVFLIGDNQRPAMDSYYFRGNNPPFRTGESFRHTDLRTMAGAARLQRKTGFNMVKTIGADRTKGYNAKENRVTIMGALAAAEDAQLEGRDFLTQRTYVKNSGKTNASVWETKKNPDKTHVALMQNSRMNNYFSGLEVDNDVDPKEFESFTQAYEEVMSKLPKVSPDRAPILKVRKLGRHRASGVYFPTKNVVAVDVNTSGSFVHEMMHHSDFAEKGTVSHTPEFRELTKEYSRGFELPAGMGAKKRDYYCSGHEILARGMELYASEKLGINNRLLDTTGHEDFDFKPFQDNPELKRKVFAFIDKNFY